MSTAVDWLVPWHALAVAQLDDVFGPLDIPDGMTVEPKSSAMFEEHTAEARWTLRLSMESGDRRATAWVSRRGEFTCRVEPDALVLDRKQLVWERHWERLVPHHVDSPQQVVDAIAEWCAGSGQLDLGASA